MMKCLTSRRQRLLAVGLVAFGLSTSAALAGFPHPPIEPPTGVSPEPPLPVIPPDPLPEPPKPPPPVKETPEPGTLALGLVAAGIAGWAARRRRKADGQ